MTLLSFPAITDDTGDGKSGTVANAAWQALIKAAIEAVTHNTTYPLIDPNDITEEVGVARGSTPTLDTRFSVEHNADGTQKAGTFALATDVRSQLASFNLIRNGEFIFWPTVAPSPVIPYWSAAGTVTYTRSGIGEADTTQKIGSYAVKAVAAAGDMALSQNIWGSEFPRTDFPGRKFQFGCWIKTSTAASFFLRIADGISNTDSTKHTGSGNWEFLTVTRTLDANSASLAVSIRNTAAGTVYVSGATAALSSVALVGWHPAPMQTLVLPIPFLAGDVSTGIKCYWVPPRFGRVVRVWAYVNSVPTTTNVKVDLLTPNAAGTYVSMFGATKCEIPPANNFSAAATPDSTYERRCLRRGTGSGTIGEGNALRVDVTADTGNTAADLAITVQYEVYIHHNDYEALE